MQSLRLAIIHRVREAEIAKRYWRRLCQIAPLLLIVCVLLGSLLEWRYWQDILGLLIS